ncbi:MAG: hypothetical protein ACKVOH_05365 [Chlamydiales bacterium]
MPNQEADMATMETLAHRDGIDEGVPKTPYLLMGETKEMSLAVLDKIHNIVLEPGDHRQTFFVGTSSLAAYTGSKFKVSPAGSKCTMQYIKCPWSKKPIAVPDYRYLVTRMEDDGQRYRPSVVAEDPVVPTLVDHAFVEVSEQGFATLALFPVSGRDERGRWMALSRTKELQSLSSTDRYGTWQDFFCYEVDESSCAIPGMYHLREKREGERVHRVKVMTICGSEFRKYHLQSLRFRLTLGEEVPLCRLDMQRLAFRGEGDVRYSMLSEFVGIPFAVDEDRSTAKRLPISPCAVVAKVLGADSVYLSDEELNVLQLKREEGEETSLYLASTLPELANMILIVRRERENMWRVKIETGLPADGVLKSLLKRLEGGKFVPISKLEYKLLQLEDNPKKTSIPGIARFAISKLPDLAAYKITVNLRDPTALQIRVTVDEAQ